jgi:hypothetical protein
MKMLFFLYSVNIRLRLDSFKRGFTTKLPVTLAFCKISINKIGQKRMDKIPQEFVAEIVKFGVISYSDQQSVWQVAKKCAKQIGVPAAAGGALIGMKAGSVTIPLGPLGGAITLTGAAAGFLAGLFGGTISCTAANTMFRPQLHKLVNETRGKIIK